MSRTRLLFSAAVGHVKVKDHNVIVQIRDDDITSTHLDDNCNIIVNAITTAFSELQKTPLVTIVTPTEILTNLTLTEKRLLHIKRIFDRAHDWIEFSFDGTSRDADLLSQRTIIQVFGTDLSVPCA